MEELKGKILITGGAGTLGKAIIKRATQEDWDCDITIYSTDAVKHARVTNEYPHVQSIIGDIGDYTTLYSAMSGKDIVIHAAAVKEIPSSESHSIDTYRVNVDGSMNVAMAAAQLKTPHVLAISTDKACHAANAYGATKYMMEKAWQEYSRYGFPTKFHLVRYGNVLESNASVLQKWKEAAANGEPVYVTNPNMTRFWISPSQAVQYVINSLHFDSGDIYVPKMSSLSIGKLMAYTIGPNYKNVKKIPMRPGEKMHETLVTIEELDFCIPSPEFFSISPTTTKRIDWDSENDAIRPYSSDMAHELTEKELENLLKG